MVELLQLFERAPLRPWLLGGALVAARLGPLTLLLPAFRLPQAAPALRMVLVAGLTVALLPLALASQPRLPPDGLSFGLALLAEATLGTIFAFAAGLPLFALDWAGQLVDGYRGASMAQLAAVGSDAPTSPLGQLHLLLGVVVFVGVGGPRVVVSLLAEGLAVAPIGAPLGGAGLEAAALGAAHLAALALALAFAIAAPAAVSVVLGDLILGLLGRAAPQLPLYFAAMPLRATLALAASALSLSLVVDHLPEHFDAALRAGARLLRALSG